MGLGDVAWSWTAFLSLLGEGGLPLVFGWLLWISEKRSKRTVNVVENQRLQGKDSAERRVERIRGTFVGLELVNRNVSQGFQEACAVGR